MGHSLKKGVARKIEMTMMTMVEIRNITKVLQSIDF
jgi:hypothetical protein